MIAAACDTGTLLIVTHVLAFLAGVGAYSIIYSQAAAKVRKDARED
jgi:hypothetical protein